MSRIETDHRSVAVTDLAQLARCEQQMVLDRQFGKQRPPARERLARAGEAEHRRHDRLARQYQGQGRGRARDARCFVASAVYGESAWQTDVLRNWRDRVLIGLYYRVSPVWVRWLAPRPRLTAAVRSILDGLVARVVRSDKREKS